MTIKELKDKIEEFPDDYIAVVLADFGDEITENNFVIKGIEINKPNGD